MEIRELHSIEDLRAAVRAHDRAFREAYDGLLPESVIEEVTTPPDDESLRNGYEVIADEAGTYLVAERAGDVVGYARFRWGETKPFVGEDEAGLKELYVDPDHWGEGVGTALLDAGLERLPNDVEAVALETLAENDRARAFYEARGFDLADTYVEHLDGEPVEHAVYRRSLDEE